MTDDIKNHNTASQILRGRLDQVRARYDSGAIPQALFEALKAMEREIAWAEYKSNVDEEV